MRRRGLAGACIALAAIGMLAAGSAHAAVPAGFYGVSPQTQLGAADVDRMGRAKVGTLRFAIPWGQIDPSPAAGDYDWGAIDALVADASRNGIELLPFFYSTPAWVARDLDRQRCSDTGCFPFAPRSRAALTAWRTFLADAVSRYGPNGEFWAQSPQVPENPITAWQIWNEQNSPSFYKPKPKPRAFAKLLDASSRGIKSVDGGAEIILGGMFGTPLGKRKFATWKFLESLYDVKGAKNDFDGVAPHPYAARLKKVRAQVDLIRDEMRKAGDRNAELWVTELGWGSGGPENPLNRGLRGQATRLKQAFEFFARKRRAWNVTTVVWYSWQDNLDDPSLCVWCPQSGLLTPSGEEKPSYRAYVKLTGGN
jgi:polysaccharide biosynthesis protein PslG